MKTLVSATTGCAAVGVPKTRSVSVVRRMMRTVCTAGCECLLYGNHGNVPFALQAAKVFSMAAVSMVVPSPAAPNARTSNTELELRVRVRTELELRVRVRVRTELSVDDGKVSATIATMHMICITLGFSRAATTVGLLGLN